MSTTGLIQLDKCADLKLLSHKQFPHLWLVTWSHLKPQIVFFKERQKMIQEKHRWTNRSCLFWLPAIRTQFHPSLERGPKVPNSLTSFCLESHVRAFQTECILVATNVIGAHVFTCNKCVCRCLFDTESGGKPVFTLDSKNIPICKLPSRSWKSKPLHRDCP